MEKIELVRRGDAFDIHYYNDGYKGIIGSGTWAYVETAKIFYMMEHIDVRILDV